MLNQVEMSGQVRTHVIQVDDPRFAAQPTVVHAFLELRRAAHQAGFDLMPFSSFRDFKTQLRIWNHKYTGKKPLYDIQGHPRQCSDLTPEAIVWHILDWSALPGGSRHHWGTEIDIVDAAAMPDGYRVKLLPEEVSPGGLFYPLHQWLEVNIESFGFFQPYQFYQGGMFPEPWHLSYAPLAMELIEHISIDYLRSVIAEAEILGKDYILQVLPDIVERHILNIVTPGSIYP